MVSGNPKRNIAAVAFGKTVALSKLSGWLQNRRQDALAYLTRLINQELPIKTVFSDTLVYLANNP
jgi:hypothetical protein